MWTLGGYAVNPSWHTTRAKSLTVPVVFNIKAPFHPDQASMTVSKCYHQYAQSAKNVQLFFTWSVHTVYTARVVRHESSYIGMIDYRVLLDYILHAESTRSCYLIPM